MSLHIPDSSLAAFGDDPRFPGTVSGVHLKVDQNPRVHAYAVHSDAGGRAGWHLHERGQPISCIAGRRHVGTRDGGVVYLRPGSAMGTDAGDEHRHGAAAGEAMTNVAVQTGTAGIGVRWLEALPEADWAAVRQ